MTGPIIVIIGLLLFGGSVAIGLTRSTSAKRGAWDKLAPVLLILSPVMVCGGVIYTIWEVI